MPKLKTDFQIAAGKLVSAVQKEWGSELGETNVDFSEKVMDAAHDLLQAGSAHQAKKILGPRSVKQFLGDVWVQAHPSVIPNIVALENLLSEPSETKQPPESPRESWRPFGLSAGR